MRQRLLLIMVIWAYKHTGKCHHKKYTKSPWCSYVAVPRFNVIKIIFNKSIVRYSNCHTYNTYITSHILLISLNLSSCKGIDGKIIENTQITEPTKCTATIIIKTPQKIQPKQKETSNNTWQRTLHLNHRKTLNYVTNKVQQALKRTEKTKFWVFSYFLLKVICKGVIEDVTKLKEYTDKVSLDWQMRNFTPCRH